MNKSTSTAFILGFLTSVMFALVFMAGQQYSSVETNTVQQNRQILLDSKIHLIEMKVDVITEQKDTSELQTDYSHLMDVLAQSHQYTGEGVIARDTAMREGASRINEAIVAGGKGLVEAIESLLETIEQSLHSHEEEEEEEEDVELEESEILD